MFKPIYLQHVLQMAMRAKTLGSIVISAVVIGLLGESRLQIRYVFAFAADPHIDLVNSHIATPLQNTRLMDIYRVMRPADSDTATLRYFSAIIKTDAFTLLDLKILRTFEWNSINFTPPDKAQHIANLVGITLKDARPCRISTRNTLLATSGWVHSPKPTTVTVKT